MWVVRCGYQPNEEQLLGSLYAVVKSALLTREGVDRWLRNCGISVSV